MQTDQHSRLANRLGYCNRELRKQDCVRPLDGLPDQQVTTNQHPMVGGSMQVGDLVQQRSDWRNRQGDLGIVLEPYGDASVTVYIFIDGTRRNYPLTSVIKVSQKK